MTRRAALALGLWLCASVLAPTGAGADTLVIGRARADSVFADVAEQVVADAARRAGLDAEFRVLPLLRSVELADEGQIDGDVARTADVSRRYPNLVALAPPVIRADIAVYGTSPALLKATRDDIRRLRVCVPRGSYVVLRHAEGMTVEESPTRSAVFDMLSGGRCDVGFMVYLDSDAASRGRDYVRWPFLWASEPLHLALHRRHAAAIARLQQALSQMQREGTIERRYEDGLRSVQAPKLELARSTPK